MRFPMIPTWKTRAIALVVAIATAWAPFGITMANSGAATGSGSSPDDIEQGAAAGHNLGAEQVSPGEVFRSSGSGSDTYSYDAGGERETIKMEELFPGSKDRIDTNKQKQLYESDNKEMMKQGRQRNQALHNEANTPEGQAHDVLRDSAEQSSPDFQNSPLGSAAKNAYGNSDLIGNSFKGCETKEGLETVTRSKRISELHQCKRTIDKTANCTVKHDYSAAIIKPHSGPWNTAPCGRGCQLIWIGRVGDNYWGGYCSEYSHQTEFEIVAPEAIKSAKLIRAKWDDHMKVFVGKPGQNYQKVWQGPYNSFPERIENNYGFSYYQPACELSTSWDRNPGVNLTNIFTSVDPGDVIRFKVVVSVAGKGEGYGRIRIRYDTDDAITQDNWYPDDCIEAAQGFADGQATGSIECTVKPQQNGNGCAVLDGFTICPHDLKSSPVPGVGPLCKEAQVDVTYTVGGGDGETIDSCQQFEDDPSCGFVSSRCSKGNEGTQSGKCYSRVETWDCGKTVTWEEHVAETKYQCGGSIRCMGDECAKPSNQRSGSFQRAATILEAADYMMMDAECSDSSDTTKNIDLKDCEVFAGEAGECKMALGSYKNCCKNPGGPSLKDYLALMQAMQKLDQATGITNTILQTQGGQALQGAWEQAANAADQVWSTISQEFSSAFNSIAGNTAKQASTETFAKGFKQTLIDQTAEWVGQIFGEAAKNALFSGGGAGGGYQLGGQGAWAGNIIAGVMMAYMIYVILKAVINIVYKCEEDEIKIAAKRALKSCHKVGEYCDQEILDQCTREQHAYCCFNSPLSRIMQEEIRKQLGDLDWGTAKNPNCGGISPRRLDEIDWDKVDLSEWTAILADTGNLPNPKNIDMESLTGDGNYLSEGTGGDRANVEERSQSRVEQIEVDDKHEKATGELHGMYPPEQDDQNSN